MARTRGPKASSCVAWLPLLLVLGCTDIAVRPSESPGRAKADPRLSIKLARQATFANKVPHLDSPAPDFTLKTLDGQSVNLATLSQGKILVLEFGNYTCPPFLRRTPFIREIATRYADQVNLATVYSREANAGRYPFESIATPKTFEERLTLAKAYTSEHGITWPIVVDEMDDRTFHAYGEPFTATFIVARDGRLAFKGTWVPPRIVEDEIRRLLGLNPPTQSTTSGLASAPSQRTTVKLEGLVCAGCVIAVKNALMTTPGVLDAEVSLERLKATVTYDPASISPEAIAQAVHDIGFGAKLTAQVVKDQ